MNPNPEDKPMTEASKSSTRTKGESVANSSQRITEFEDAVNAAVEECGEFGYFPGYFVQMIREKGALMTAKQLVASGEIQSGLQLLARKGRLDFRLKAPCADSPTFSPMRKLRRRSGALMKPRLGV